MFSPPSSPLSLKSPEAIAERTAALDLPHVAPLVDWLQERKATLAKLLQLPEVQLPLFDPFSGGVHTQVLLLLESPGPKASAGKGSGFISCDNNDQTAKNVFLTLQEADLPRSQVMCWNVVPWYLHEVRKPNRQELNLGMQELRLLLPLLSELQVVVLHGKAAQEGWKLLPYKVQEAHKILEVGHPSPTNFNTRPLERQKLLQAYQQAAQHIRDT
ncbi:uracil-DNA glycosylase [Deinococcus cellulosilyticus]|uniref:Uracil-DNA glycosylase-like domain-containing protein n=1 Tax=Deinococcus cellulosilyticus (strain DSM 18568 / NBRC 106333 / KACC 11606 / 5516J-15) TaxID=1223518 RepID=A0A511N4K6_DEIC1|nr:uracil-DNA glycosylase [Deinococcus cellulosilyticus]GEM47321.1 hypothetical protein DC3_29560 [Deinococcus cellulosilyticus NBRC 106333 = KACC 11606]